MANYMWCKRPTCILGVDVDDLVLLDMQSEQAFAGVAEESNVPRIHEGQHGRIEHHSGAFSMLLERELSCLMYTLRCTVLPRKP